MKMTFKPVVIEQGEQFKFTTPGESLTGYYQGSQVLELGGKAVNKYVIKTTTGTKDFLGSFALDEGFKKVPVGAMTRVTYKELKKLKGGKTLKVFAIEVDADDMDNGATTTTAQPMPTASMNDKVNALKTARVSA